MKRQEAHSEEAQVARARRQLIAVGAVCVTAVIVLIWAYSLRSTFARNKKAYTSTIPADGFYRTYQEVGKQWDKLRNTVTP